MEDEIVHRYPRLQKLTCEVTRCGKGTMCCYGSRLWWLDLLDFARFAKENSEIHWWGLQTCTSGAIPLLVVLRGSLGLSTRVIDAGMSSSSCTENKPSKTENPIQQLLQDALEPCTVYLTTLEHSVAENKADLMISADFSGCIPGGSFVERLLESEPGLSGLQCISECRGWFFLVSVEKDFLKTEEHEEPEVAVEPAQTPTNVNDVLFKALALFLFGGLLALYVR